MRRPSSTSGSSRWLGRWVYPAVACLSMAAGIKLLDQAVWSQVSPWSAPEWQEKRAALMAVQRRGQPVDLVVVGDSTMTSGIFPALIAGSHGFNLGRSSLNPSELRPLERQMEALGLRPKTVLISFTPFNVANNNWEDHYAAPLPEKAAALKNNFYANTAISDALLLPGKTVALGLLATDLKSKPVRLNPFAAPERTFDIAPDGTRVPRTVLHSDAEARFETDFPAAKRFTIPPSAFQELTAFKAACEARGAEVYWVCMPIHPAYEALLRERQPALWRSYQDGIADLFGKRVLRLPAPARLDAFQDGVHLTPDAAREFTRRIAALIPARG